MTVTVPDHPTWPDGDPGKALLNCIINTNVDQVFEELFGSYPETQVNLLDFWSAVLTQQVFQVVASPRP